MVLIHIFILMLSLPQVFAQNCALPMTLDTFHNLLDETINQNFPELKASPISVKTFESDAYFLQAQPVMSSLVRKKVKRSYEVQLNLRLLACPPEMDALQAILVHELEHIKDYEGWSSDKILRHGIKYISNRKFRTIYERETDLKTMQKGFSESLKGYRYWVYQWLTPAQLKIKKRYYFTPEEITGWQDNQQVGEF